MIEFKTTNQFFTIITIPSNFSVTCGLYVNIILGDYLRTILNLNDNPVASDWKLDPRENFSNVFDPDGTPRGLGNQVSAEFNFVYRWRRDPLLL